MRAELLILLFLFTLSVCDNSGIKVAITSNIFKILEKFDISSILKDKTLIDRAEASGKYLFNYDVVCENLFLTELVQPDYIEILQETTAEGYPQVKVTAYNIEAAIQIEYLYVKYGLIKETFDNPTGSVSLSYVEGRYHFTEDGKLVLSEFNIEIDDMTIDVRKDFLNWLINLFKGLIKSEVTKKLNELGGTISEQINNWVDGEFSLDIGYGIGLNLTNTLKPNLTQIYKNKQINEISLLIIKSLFSKEYLSETLSSVLTFGIKGSCYPSEQPELMPDIPPAADMDFNQDYFTNELQILISTYTLNTLLLTGQSIGFLSQEFTNASHPIFPWNFDTVGLQEILPQYEEKYPGQNLEVQMNAYVSALNHLRPYIESSETGAKLVVNFNLDFLTSVSDDPVLDLSLNVTGELPFTIQVKYDLLTINWGTFNIVQLDENKNELNVPYDDLVNMVGNMLDNYVVKFIKGYTKNVALAAILTLVTGMDFKNFKFETKEGYLLVSIAANLDK
jgi:hypothetical protein